MSPLKEGLCAEPVSAPCKPRKVLWNSSQKFKFINVTAKYYCVTQLSFIFCDTTININIINPKNFFSKTYKFVKKELENFSRKILRLFPLRA